MQSLRTDKRAPYEKLRNRFLVLFGVCGLILATFITWTWRNQSDQITNIRSLRAAQHQQLAEAIVRADGKLLRAYGDSYGPWTEFCHAIEKGDRSWYPTNLNTMEAFQGEVQWVFDLRGQIVWSSSSHGKKDLERLRLKESIVTALQGPMKLKSFYTVLDGKLFEMCGVAVTKSDDLERKGKTYGYLLAGREWSPAVLDGIGHRAASLSTRWLPADASIETKQTSALSMIELTGLNGQVVAQLEFNYSRLEDERTAAEIRRVLWITVAFVGLTALLVVISLRAWVLDPLKKLEIALRENSTAAVESLIAANDDFSRIARLVRHNQRQRIELTIALEEVRAAEEQAEQANRAKSQFLANMSHEIRTPMNGILGIADLMLESEQTPDSRENLELIRSSAEALTGLINDILDLSKIEAGKFTLNLRPFDVKSLVEEVGSLFRAGIQKRGVVIRGEVDPSISNIRLGDPDRIRQILANLVGNAAKFTPSGEIVLRVCPSSRVTETGVIRFEIRDTGIGIPADRQLCIFDDFTQADGSTTRKYGGTGLGLGICKRLAELMGGSIGVSSEVGVGSVFWVELPLQEASESQILLDPIAATPAIGSPRSSPATKLRVLLVEDNPVNQKVAQRLLQSIECDLSLVENGQEAIDRLAISTFDIVLMDVQMPVMDGLQATRHLRSQGNQVPIIAMTANAMDGDREICLQAGMNSYVSKPIKKEALLSAIEGLMQEKAA